MNDLLADNLKPWAGRYGEDYTDRCSFTDRDTNRAPLWEPVLARIGPSSVIEFGCNAGRNLEAIHKIDPSVKLTGLDISASALAFAEEIVPAALLGHADVTSDLSWMKADLAFCAGVMIHLDTNQVSALMQNLIACAIRWVLIVEDWSASDSSKPYHFGATYTRRPYDLIFEEASGARRIASGHLEHPSAWDDTSWWLWELAQ